MQQRVEFHARADRALHNPQIRSNFRYAMDGLIDKRKRSFPDLDELNRLRLRCAEIRVNALSKLPELLEQLEACCTKNGIQVHWAETVGEANRIVLDIMNRHNAKLLIKGKSMVSEEMELNHYLEQQGIECLESDLGEYILQLAGEPPSHIVAPAIHKSRQQVAQLFKEKFPDIPYSDDVDRLTRNARHILRRKFYEAPVGLSGVNFAVAETGTICLVENEGNGRMCTTIPPVHIAVTGIEKVVEKLSDIPPLLSILPRSATGQHITTYFNMITSPRKPGEKDGPDEVHLVLLDNGRSRIYEDQELIATLRCIRCGACMNHCPVYTRIGGHAYGTTIPGPIGSILEPQKAGLDRYGDLPTASTLCGACGEVCPVRIPIPALLNRLRFERVRQDHTGVTRGQGSQRDPWEARIWKGWSWMHANPAIYRLGIGLAAGLRWMLPKRLGAWTRVRSAPRLAAKSLHKLAREKDWIMSDARSNILARLRAGKPDMPAASEPTQIPLAGWDLHERVRQFRKKMESVRAEVHVTPRESWLALLRRLVAEKQISTLLYAPDGPLGEALFQAWESPGESPLIARSETLEEWKEELFFNVDGAITSSRWGIAETGTLVLWPTPEEPRSFSLVPPVHIAILEAGDIYNTFADLIEKEKWNQRMPTNALLISGPSKTADIEQTLAYGVHGPIELVIIVVTEEN